MGDKIVKSKNLCCQPVVFPSLSLLKPSLTVIIFSILDFIAKVVEKVCKCVKDTLYGILKQEEQPEKKHSEEQKMETRGGRRWHHRE